jgi:formylglycine-generating enzyme required for sulfatase activity
MVAIMPEPGSATFLMGAPEDGKAYDAADEPRYRAKIERPFAISATETTVAQMEQFLSGYRARRDEHRKKDDRTKPGDADQQSEPISFVPLLHAMAYCNWLSRRDGIPQDQWCYSQAKLDEFLQDRAFAPVEAVHIARNADFSKIGYRLPTEVEWEYACRAGTESSRHFGSTDELVSRYAYHRNNSSSNMLSPVARHMPSAWGLFDMLGNVAEWCHDAPATAKVDAAAAPDGKLKPRGSKRSVSTDLSLSSIVRGGSLYDESVIVRSSYRILVRVDEPQRDHGFRVARTLPGE